MRPEPSILTALFNHMAAFPTVMEIVWAGMNEAPDGRYIDVAVVPNTVDQASFGDEGKNRHVGNMLIGVLWETGKGIIAPAEVAAEIAAHFKRGTAIVCGDVTVRTGPPRTAQALPDGNKRIRLPVIVPWFADTTKS